MVNSNIYIRNMLKKGLGIIKQAYFVPNKYPQLISFIKKIKARYESGNSFLKFFFLRLRLSKTISYEGNIRPPLTQAPFCQAKLHFYWGKERFLRTILLNSPILNKDFLNFSFEMFLSNIRHVCFIKHQAFRHMYFEMWTLILKRRN